ncbi:hypothetical protein SAMN04515668_0298 [Hymenobacter arizonensis]|uniref:DUF7033 domain-containing protein n=2 Tax=Hymenobacter arizonensis TaxID=1227077 RepID=A0A1I5T305_HYMAR|nr:hypothetical protein SAMN04515668_0298 [Hymenobacter arizonensis]
MKHFRLAYLEVPDVRIGDSAIEPGIVIKDGAADFFIQTLAYPPAPTLRDWLGTQVPFFFDASPGAPLLELRPDRAIINSDIISAAFYLLSGWQEYYVNARDQHGRFPYAASVQKQYGFVTLPVVNYYFDVLKTAIEHVTGQRIRPRAWVAGAPFATFISHDIDNLRSAWKGPAKAALQRGHLLDFGKLLGRHLTQPDAWDNLEAVAAATAAYGARSTFFVLPEHRPGADGTPNADYVLSPSLKNRFSALQAQGCELGLHGSIGTATDAERLNQEVGKVLDGPSGLRFHYLRWEPRLTPALVDAIGFEYDSTLGFAEHFGFRHSYCLPFFPFNFVTEAAHHFLEIPLNVMDATLHHPSYLNLRPEEVLPALRPMLAEIEQFGGVATVLWHNENFDPANTKNGPQQFAELMSYLQQRGTAFLTGAEICQAFRR